MLCHTSNLQTGHSSPPLTTSQIVGKLPYVPYQHSKTPQCRLNKEHIHIITLPNLLNFSFPIPSRLPLKNPFIAPPYQVTMSPIRRITLFKIPSESDISAVLSAYDVLMTTNLKVLLSFPPLPISPSSQISNFRTQNPISFPALPPASTTRPRHVRRGTRWRCRARLRVKRMWSFMTRSVRRIRS